MKLLANDLAGYASENGIKLAELESWSWIMTSNFVVIQKFVAKEPSEFERLTAGTKRSVREKVHCGVKYKVGSQHCYFRPDERTVIIGSEAAVKVAIAAGSDATVRAEWLPHVKSLSQKPAWCIFDLVNIGKKLERFAAGVAPESPIGQIAPLWRNGEVAAVSLSLKGKIQLRGQVTAKNEGAAPEIQKALRKLVQFTRIECNRLAKRTERAATQPNQYNPSLSEARIQEQIASYFSELLDSAETEHHGNEVRVTMTSGVVRTARIAHSLAVDIRTLWRRDFEDRTQPNLSRIGNAMHNYHNKWNRFPNASQFGTNGIGEHRVSWRILLLPHLNESHLYDAYRFDEPWDSPANRAATAHMPDVFRAPGSPADSTNTSYFAVVGTDKSRTVFGDHTTRIDDILDGTTTTLLIVESKRRIHWAKPEDIPYAPNKPLPKFGGITPTGFRALCTDGSMRYIGTDVSESAIRNFLTIADVNKLDEKTMFSKDPIRVEVPAALRKWRK